MSGDHLAGALVGVYAFVFGQKLRLLLDEVGALSRDWRGMAAIVLMSALALLWPLWPVFELWMPVVGRWTDFRCCGCGWTFGGRWRWLVAAKWKWHRMRSPGCAAPERIR